jgi:hypothetical protein
MKIRVNDHIFPSDRFRVRFRVSDVLSTALIYMAMDNFLVDPGVPSSVPGDDARSEALAVAVMPNPLRGSGSVALHLPVASSYLRVELFNSLGEQRALLHEGSLGAGDHRFNVSDDLPSGSYAVRVTDRRGGLRSTWFQVVR